MRPMRNPIYTNLEYREGSLYLEVQRLNREYNAAVDALVELGIRMRNAEAARESVEEELLRTSIFID